jgi:hypothetical protein
MYKDNITEIDYSQIPEEVKKNVEHNIIKKYLTNCKINGNTRKTRWWFNFINKNINKFNRVITDVKKVCTQIDKVISLNNAYYPNNWDFHIDYDCNLQKYSFVMLFYFDKPTITNSKEHSHEMLNFIISLSFEIINDNFQFNGIKGGKTQFYQKEYKEGYVHSHISSNINTCFEFKSFCLGSSEYKAVENSIIFSEEFDADLYEYYIQFFKSIVTWESLEGRPYRHINNLTPAYIENQNNDLPSHKYIRNLIDDYLNTIFIKQLLAFVKPKLYLQENIFKMQKDSLIQQKITYFFICVYVDLLDTKDKNQYIIDFIDLLENLFIVESDGISHKLKYLFNKNNILPQQYVKKPYYLYIQDRKIEFFIKVDKEYITQQKTKRKLVDKKEIIKPLDLKFNQAVYNSIINKIELLINKKYEHRRIKEHYGYS